MVNLKEQQMRRRRKPKGMSFIRNAIYAVYKGEELIATGTADECAEVMGVKPKYIYYLTSPTHERRLAKRKNPDKATTAVIVDWEE